MARAIPERRASGALVRKLTVPLTPCRRPGRIRMSQPEMPQSGGTQAAAPISVLLVDDHMLVRRGFRRLLEDDPAIRVVAEAGDGQEAIDLALKHHPRVVVMDFALPSMNGALATQRIMAALPDTAVLILSMHPEPVYVRNCMEAGARGYLLKNAMDLELAEAVKTIASGGRVLDPRIAWSSGVGGCGRSTAYTARTRGVAIDRAWQIEQRYRGRAGFERQYGRRSPGEDHGAAGDA